MITNLIVIQPIDLCNLNCSYCYLPGRKNTKKMSNEVLEKIFKCIFNSKMTETNLNHDILKILWHSGEPLLAGIDFYQQALMYVNKHNTRHAPVYMEFQTNATPINQQWCDFIKDNAFGIAVSIDGPEFLHDKYRRTWKNKGSFNLVMRGIENLKKNNIPLRGICVLTKESLNHPIELYEFFLMHGFESINFNVEETECFNQVSSLKLNAESPDSNQIIGNYNHFMSVFYDRWKSDGKPFHIREFDHVINILKFRKSFGHDVFLPSLETMAFGIVTINKDGDVSTFSPELSGGTLTNPREFFIGNVMNIDTLDELVTDTNFQKQLHDVNKGIEMCAQQCKYFSVCGGGSASNKYYENGRFDSTTTSTCRIGKMALTDLIINKLQSESLQTIGR